jgi:predicted ArsR family transcriptional regulator
MSSNSNGKREKVTMQEIERVIRESGEPVTARELSDNMPITNTQMNRKLKRLSESGKIRRKKVGSAAVVYWHPDCFGHRQA